LTQGRITAKHRRFNQIRQAVTMCTPYDSLGQPKSTFQTASRLVQPFSQGSWSRQTNSPCYSICSNRQHLRSTILCCRQRQAFNRTRQVAPMCPTGGHTGATWQTRLNSCFHRPTRIHNPNGKLIAQPFLHSSRQKVPILDNGRHFPLKLPLAMGGSGPHLTRFLGPIHPNGITTGWAIFFTDDFRLFLYFTLGRPYHPSKIVPFHGGPGPHLLHGSLGPPESSTQTASESQSVQPFMQGSLVWQTVKPTDHATQS